MKITKAAGEGQVEFDIQVVHFLGNLRGLERVPSHEIVRGGFG
jgi:hypothetical protein